MSSSKIYTYEEYVKLSLSPQNYGLTGVIPTIRLVDGSLCGVFGVNEDGKLSIFGGKIEKNEKITECASRELYEESGETISIKLNSRTISHVYVNSYSIIFFVNYDGPIEEIFKCMETHSNRRDNYIEHKNLIFAEMPMILPVAFDDLRRSSELRHTPAQDLHACINYIESLITIPSNILQQVHSIYKMGITNYPLMTDAMMDVIKEYFITIT